MSTRLALATLVCVTAVVPAAAAESKHDVRTERLRGFTTRDLTLIEPLSEAGPAALVEFADTEADRLPAINVAVRVNASTERVLEVIARPEAYPSFMGTLDRVKVIKRERDTTVYDWGWDMAVFRLGGRNIMRVYRSPGVDNPRGHRVTIDSTSGDFGTGRMSLRVLPRPYGSLVVIAVRLDLRKANYIARQAARAARSVNRTANMALGYAMVMNFKDRAEGQPAGGRPAARTQPARELVPPAVDLKKLWPLLTRGDVVLSRVDGKRLLQTSVLGLIHYPSGSVREVMLDTEAFGSALVPGSKAKIVERRDKRTVFDWDIDIPVVGVSGRMAVQDEAPVVSVEALEGALQGGRWRFHTQALGKRSTLVSSWADFDLRDSNWVLERIIATDTYLAHGINAASEVMLLRALRSRTRKRVEEERGQTAAVSHAR